MPANRRVSSDRYGTNIYRQPLPEAEATCYGFRYKKCNLFLYYILTIFLLGLPVLLGKWFKKYKIRMLCGRSPLRNATVILVKDETKNYFISEITEEKIENLPDFTVNNCPNESPYYDASSHLCTSLHNVTTLRYFVFRYEKFAWDDRQAKFKRVDGLENIELRKLSENFRGLSHTKRQQLRGIYGSNIIDVEVPSYMKLLFEEVLNPFYCFQVLSVILWSFDEYYYYASCVVAISALSIIASLIETRRQSEMLRDMAQGNADFIVTVRRWDGEEEEINCRDLVPGDVMLIPPEGIVMPADAVVIQGSCIVNESMLTGESVPVTKSALQPSNEMYNEESHKRHTVFNGTSVIQTRFYAGNKVACVIVKTGYSTLKGQLIRSIIFPKELGFQFYVDAMKFVAMLFCLAAIGMTYCIYLYVVRQTHWTTALVRILDIITIVVPPALPAAMTVGTFYAQARLKKKQIFCISPPRINFCGKISLVAFDKTGTLTEDGLDFWCVVPFEEDKSDFSEPVTELPAESDRSHYVRCCASCHSLTYINGQLIGDPLDVKMFVSTAWELEEPLMNKGDTRKFDMLMPNVVKKGDTELGILREFEFTPQLQRMSVVVQPLDSTMTLYCKGAPERLRPLCTNEFPDSFDRVLDSFTLKGYRVLALAYKQVVLKWHEVHRVERDELEKDMIFCGFLVMQNSLKPATMPVIKELNAASIRSVMVTGDNMLTALSVARECGMISSADKVVIVTARDDRNTPELEFTLATQHYEAPEESESNELTISRSSGSAQSISHQPILTSDTECQSNDNDLGDTLIDMERLVPITVETFAATILELQDSNYHLVLNGKTWTILNQLFPVNVIEKIVAKGTVYARMSPECKRQLVESLQNIGYVVAMCGDGANDCSALKMAHVGISLSDAEASVAAPFTSKIQDISSVPHLIREGRCALVTSFGIFKYMALYSMVQFVSVLTLYAHKTNFADTQFLFIDLGITTTIAVVMGRTEPHPRLVTKRPMGSLISFQNIVSILLQIFTSGVIQLGAISLLKTESWFKPVQPTSPEEIIFECWETTTIFSVSAFQYLILALVFSKGPPFRKPFYSNGLFLLAYATLTSLTILLAVYPVGQLAEFFILEPVSQETTNFRLTILAFPVINIIASLYFENGLATSRFVKKLGKWVCRKKKRHRFKELLEHLDVDHTWPPIKS
ncbi:unnamed protein product [Allacma fusca]|uniref:Cation-transporting ATPase n=1 Tax=Allacma fusca TaxID=39272 RepID=A0A8J2K2Y1_9HEXA|nr:unnamed protein product [Allacma fusca]